MKKITCVIRSQKLEEVKKTLTDAGIVGMTVTEVRGYGKQKGFVHHYRASETLVNLIPKTKIEVVVKDEELQKTIDAIVGAAKTGEVGDGKIFVSELVDVIRIRTGEKGKEAI